MRARARERARDPTARHEQLMPRGKKLGRAPKKRKTTPASKRAAKKNGAKGGRPRDKLPKTSLDKLGPPPLDAKGRAEWKANVLTEVLWLSLSGAISNELATSIRAGAKSLDGALPAKPGGNDPADDDDDGDEEPGPELAPARADRSLRVG